MAKTAVDIVIQTIGQSKLDRLNKSFQNTNQKIDKLSSNISTKLTPAFQKIGAAGIKAGNLVKRGFRIAEKSAEALQNKLKGVGGTIAGIGLGAAVGRSISGAADFEQTKVRLNALSKEYGEFNQILKLTAENAKTFNLSQREASSSFADVYARLRPLGKSLEEIQTVYKGFNAVALASGASAEAASGAFLQLSQALGSGTLQGDEFRSIAEQVPGILRLVADEVGVSVDALKKLGSDGKLTADILINSLAKGFEQNKDKIEQLLALSPAQKFKNFQNATSDLSDSIGSELLPVVTPAVQGFTELINIFGRMPGVVKTLTAGIFGLAGAFGALAAAMNLFGISLTKAKFFAFIASAGKVALLAAPLAGLALALEDAARRKKALDDALASDSLSEVESQLEQSVEEMNELIDAFETVKNSPYFRGQSAEIERLRGLVEKAAEEVDLLTRRRELIIDLKINVPFPNFDKMGAGFGDELSAELEKLGLQYTPGKGPAKPIKSKGGRKGSAGRAPQDDTESAMSLLSTLKDQFALIQAMSPLQRDLLKIEIDRKNQAEDIKKFANISPELREQLEIYNRSLAYYEKVRAIQADISQKANEFFREELTRLEAAEAVVENLEDQRELLEAKLNGNEREVKLAQKIKFLTKDMNADEAAQVEALVRGNAALEDRVAIQERLKAQYTQLAGGIAEEMTGALRSVIDGTKSVEQAFADMLTGIGNKFLDMAMKLITDALTQQLVKLFGSLLGGFSGGGAGSISGYGMNSFGNFGLFADGGYVNRPTLGLIGEAGESEYIIPERKMPAAMARYSAGARGEEVMNGPDNQLLSKYSAGGNSSGTITVESNIINNVEYVTMDQARTMTEQAATAGAQRGHGRTMNVLQHSRGQRSRIGMS